MKKKHLSTAATFVGALIGAGFASGREIALYFSETSILTPILSGVLLGLFCYLFLLIGRITNGNPLLLWGKGKFVANSVIIVSNTVTLCSMTAASEMTFFALFGIHGGGIITGVLALVTVIFGVDKIKLTNFFIVPVIIILILTLLFKTETAPHIGKIVFLPAFSYCTMNIIGGGFLVSTMSADFDKKDCAITAIISGIIMTVLIVAVFIIIQNTISDDMPLMSAATASNLATVGNIAMYLAVFTTMTSCLSVVSKNKPLPSIAVTALAFAVSVLGFRTIVDKFYPVLGVLGGAVSLAYLFLYLYKTKKRRSQASLSL